MRAPGDGLGLGFLGCWETRMPERIRMPRYYFPTWDGEFFFPDEDGLEFEDTLGFGNALPSAERAIGVRSATNTAQERILPRMVAAVSLSPIRFPCSPEWWRSNEALQA